MEKANLNDFKTVGALNWITWGHEQCNSTLIPLSDFQKKLYERY